MKRLARKEIQRTKPYIPGKPIEEVKRELGLKEAIKLASNENPFPPSGKAIRAAGEALRSINRYPDGGCFYLKRALAKHLGVNTKNLVLGNGSDEIIILALRAFLEKNDEVIIAKPTFLIYEIAAQIGGARIKFAPLKDFRYDVRKIASLITKKTKLIFIANPDNPSGSYVTKKEVEYLLSRTPKKTIIFFDEAYFEFAKDVKDFPKTMKYFKKRNIIITRSFSKAYSLAGLRIGYAIAKEDIAGSLNKAREPFNVNSIAQEAAIAALGDNAYIKKTIKRIEEGKTFLCEEFDRLSIKYIPSVTNFIVFKVGKRAASIYNKLLKQGIIIRAMGAWKLKNCLRVTVGTMKENKKFIKTLEEIL